MKKGSLLIFFFPLYCYVQNAPSDANIIVIKNVGFNPQVCNTLLDSGYSIDKKDNDLHTVRTDTKQYEKYWNATYRVNIRIKDSVAYISATFTARPGGGLFKDEQVSNHTNRKGITLQKSMDGYIFLLLNDFALGFKQEVSYLKK